MAEKRLIDANYLISLFNEIAAVEWNHKAAPVCWADAYYAIIDDVENAPVVDAVEVVRCGKCKWYDPDSEYCQFWHGVRHPEHYCGEGERKDNG